MESSGKSEITNHKSQIVASTTMSSHIDTVSTEAQTGRSLLDDCVHCGFCLPVCPTYVSWHEEMDSPRGRIDLMRGLAEGTIGWSDTVARHFDRCLGCMACVTACPSGVQYDVLIEETRAKLERQHPRRPFDEFHRGMIFALFPYPRRLRAIAALFLLYSKSGLQSLVRRSGLLKLLPSRLSQMEALLPPLSARQVTSRLPARVPAQ